MPPPPYYIHPLTDLYLPPILPPYPTPLSYPLSYPPILPSYPIPLSYTTQEEGMDLMGTCMPRRSANLVQDMQVPTHRAPPRPTPSRPIPPHPVPSQVVPALGVSLGPRRMLTLVRQLEPNRRPHQLEPTCAPASAGAILPTRVSWSHPAYPRQLEPTCLPASAGANLRTRIRSS